jgi:hypothetical protein
VQAKGIFNKIITEISPNFKKENSSRYRKPPGHHKEMTEIEPHHGIL